MPRNHCPCNLVITVGYVETAVSVVESAGVAQLTVAISAPVTIETSFFLLMNTNDGTATAAAPNDYGALTGFSLGPFNNSVRQLSFNVSIVNDAILEENEDFTASLIVSPADRTRLGNRVTVQPNVATVTILNDDVVLTLDGMNLTNNSIVAMTDIGSGAAALVCTTTYKPCCSSRNPEAQWYFPNGSQIPNNPSLPYRRTRGTNPGRVFLHRNSEDTTTGIFRCDIPVASDATQSLYVRIYTPGSTQLQACYDNAAANCRGNVVTGVSTAQDCCLGDGYWFRDPNLRGCVQCIVHGFERSMVLVNEGDMQTTLVIRLDIKGNTLDEPADFKVTRINFTVMCQDVTTESDDYSSRSCDYETVIRLNRRDPGPMNSEVRITFPADNCAMEGTEELQLGLHLTRNTQNAVGLSGNVFFQNTSIQITDTTVLRPTFSLAVYEGTEGPDRRSSLDPAPCRVLVRLEGTVVEGDLAIRLIPRTFSENVAVNGPPPAAECLGFNASRMDFNDTQPFEVTIPAGTTAIRADIPIVDDDINEGIEEFVVVLEVASVTTNPVDFTGQTQTTVCRIPASDPIEIGFTQAKVQHNEEERYFTAILEKDRPSELEYFVDVGVNTPNTGDGRAATPGVDFSFGNLVSDSLQFRVSPTQDRILITYKIFQDNIPENTELIQLSSSSNKLPTFLCDADPMFRFNGRDCFRDLLIQILDDDE